MAQSNQVSTEVHNLQSTLESESARKLFVGGLSWQTTEDALHHYFESLGMEVDRVFIMRDKMTTRSRGFGFVILKNPDLLDKAVSTNLHLDGRKIEAKRAISKREMEKMSTKVFVGGVPTTLTNADLKLYFEQFGTVTESQVVAERFTGRSRGFGFVTFQDKETTEKVLVAHHTIQGKPVEVKRAEPKKDRQPRPIIVPMPVPGMYFPPGYPYPLAYAHPAMYGQPLQAQAYDSRAYFVAQPNGMIAPQFVPINHLEYEPPDTEQYDEPPLAVPAPPQPARGSRRAVVAGPRRTVLDTAPRAERAWSTSLVPVEIPTMSLVDRVRVTQNDIRKKRGMSHPERSRRAGSFTTTTSTSTVTSASGTPTQSRRPVVTTVRSRGSGVYGGSSSVNSATITATTAPTSATNLPSEVGGSLHKYFQ